MRNETRAPRPARMERRAAGRVGEERAAGAANGRAGERVRGSCRGTCAASSPRRAPRAGQRIKFILAPSAFYTAYAVGATAPGHRGVSAARRARRSIPGRVTSPVHRKRHRHRVGGFTEAGRCSDRTPVNRPRGRPVRVRRARALIDGRDGAPPDVHR